MAFIDEEKYRTPPLFGPLGEMRPNPFRISTPADAQVIKTTIRLEDIEFDADLFEQCAQRPSYITTHPAYVQWLLKTVAATYAPITLKMLVSELVLNGGWRRHAITTAQRPLVTYERIPRVAVENAAAFLYSALTSRRAVKNPTRVYVLLTQINKGPLVNAERFFTCVRKELDALAERGRKLQALEFIVAKNTDLGKYVIEYVKTCTREDTRTNLLCRFNNVALANIVHVFVYDDMENEVTYNDLTAMAECGGFDDDTRVIVTLTASDTQYVRVNKRWHTLRLRGALMDIKIRGRKHDK